MTKVTALHTENGLDYEVEGVWASPKGTAHSDRRPAHLQVEPLTELTPGVYKHHKGNLYLLCRCVVDETTGKWLVLYRALYGERRWFVRPSAMWGETIPSGAVRFSRVSPTDLESQEAVALHLSDITG